MFKSFSLTIESADWSVIAEEIAVAGPRICETAYDYLAEYPHRHRRPDRLRVHIHPDCGMLRIVLAGPKLLRGEIGVVTISRLEVDYFDLPTATGDRDEAFAAGHRQLIERCRQAIQHALSTREGAECFKRLCSQFSLRLTILEYDDPGTEQVILSRDIDQIIERVKARLPDVHVEQLWVSHPGVDDDGLWFFRLPGIQKDIQIESSFGMCPFIVEHSDMKSSSEAETARTIEDAVEKVVAYLTSLRGGAGSQ
jgi:hypothetical protein